MHTFPLVFDLQDVQNTREEADGLVSKCLLQDFGSDGYRVHDLVVDFLKDNIKADAAQKATELQAQYLGRLDVVKSYTDPRHGAGYQGLFGLNVLWRSLEKLSGDSGLEVASYRASLGELESCEATDKVANCFARVGFLFRIQVRHVFLGFTRFTACSLCS